MANRNRRQELYDRIRDSSKHQVIVEEMVRLGFWPEGEDGPVDPADETRRRNELASKIRALCIETTRLHNIESLKREARKRRLAESRRKRQENKQRKLRERAERKREWAEKKKRDIGYLGDGVSAGLGHTDSDASKLAARGLPVFATAGELAAALGISVGQLRFLAFHRETSRVSHYARFTIPKRTGGRRTISAPKPKLKRAQHKILRDVLAKIDVHDAAHGFRANRSIVTNATPHVGADVVVNVDLKDFFPTVTYPRVKGVFRALGYSEAVATILGLLCTEPETVALVLDGATYHVAVGERRLPQGAPTSPAITNLICTRLDRRLRGAAHKLGFAYTRYADDLSFSATGDGAGRVGRLLRQVEWIVAQEGFAVHPDKTRVFRKGRRQEVTGVVVNERPAVPRAELRRFRAALFRLERDGPDGVTWGNGGDVLASMLGFANYVAMVDPARGVALRDRVRAVIGDRGEPPPEPEPAAAPEPEPDADDPDTTKKKKWWKLF